MIKTKLTNKIRPPKKEIIIRDAIAHLNGYAVTMRAMTGYKPLAVLDTIKKLEGLI